MRKKTWHEKYTSRTRAVIEVTKRHFGGIPAGTRMVISTPAEIDRLVRKIPAGTEITIAELRERIAKKHHVPTACPTSTGIYLRIASEAAIEEMAVGKDINKVMPFWRAISPRSSIGKKLTCGQEFLVQMRRSEGLPV
jgi:hypothetical protein